MLKDVEARAGLLGQAARCFIDHRDPERIEHSVEELVSQRVVGLALGYEDLNDHDELRHDPLLAAVVGKSDPTGQDRVRERDRGKALAGKNTLNRLELTPADATARSRYKKIVADAPALDRLFVAHFLGAYARAPRRIVLDVDATDDPLHGHQEGRFFHGYYRHYCYLPLNGYAFHSSGLVRVSTTAELATRLLYGAGLVATACCARRWNSSPRAPGLRRLNRNVNSSR